ncbi:MAG: 2,3-diphosphoglycerate-dependent phosphoglycerate mutase [Thermodesulfobacteriota bacterium]|nr:2,3-diphosphoglycerate-dependent phosphoglycerate mutase [Thermodesulfobacteriota bacterium]
MVKVVLLRHGESLWNKENRFTGWTDVDLSDQGRLEVHRAAKLLKENGFSFDVAFTSLLKRAIRTAWIILDAMELMWIPVYHTWRLNERHYGALQGLNKRDTARKYGDEMVQKWRRSYDVSPPALENNDPRHPRFDSRYSHLSKEQLPACESLKDTIARVLPYWRETIEPRLKKGGKVLVSAHGNSLRGLVKNLDHIPDEEIAGLNIPTGFPLVYELDERLEPWNRYYLGDGKEIKQAIESAAKQIRDNRG